VSRYTFDHECTGTGVRAMMRKLGAISPRAFLLTACETFASLMRPIALSAVASRLRPGIQATKGLPHLGLE
jgi:hypothetical protein